MGIIWFNVFNSNKKSQNHSKRKQQVWFDKEMKDLHCWEKNFQIKMWL